MSVINSSAGSPITTHVLDTALGRPAVGIAAVLEFFVEGQWRPIGMGTTNSDGRIRDLLPAERQLTPGMYRLSFDTGSYFAATGTEGFYPYVLVVFELKSPETHYHVPLLLSPYGYSTYRGS